MSSSLVLFCNLQSFVIDLTYSYLYSYNLYPAVSDIYFLISLHYCSMLCMIRQLGLVHRYYSSIR